MATKVALTAEEFRENSQRSIDLFNTEKLSTDSTHVLKSVYYNSVHFCSCNLHGACGGKERVFDGNQHIALLQSARSVWRQSGKGRAKRRGAGGLQSARSVWRQSFWSPCSASPLSLQSARGVWRQRCTSISSVLLINRCNLHGACGGKGLNPNCSRSALSCNLHGACGGKDNDEIVALVSPGCNLHGACGGKVSGEDIHFVNLLVAICTERVEDLASSPEKNPRKFMQTYCIFIHLDV